MGFDPMTKAQWKGRSPELKKHKVSRLKLLSAFPSLILSYQGRWLVDAV